jgi:methionine-rich copper-binding protein CopC
MDFRRIGVGLLLVGVALVSSATPVWAHTSLKSSNPAEGASLATAPAEVQLTFSGVVSASADAVKVAAADGTQWTVGAVVAVDGVVTAPVEATGPAGVHTISYRVKSDDGHTISGAVKFSLTAGVVSSSQAPAPTSSVSSVPSVAPVSDATPTPQSDSGESGGGLPGWVWILLTVAAVVVGVFTRRTIRANGVGRE